MITNYDPNINWSVHTVELTFMQWDYSLTVQQTVTTNCRGASLFDSAISLYFDDLQCDDYGCLMVLRRPAEDGVGEDTLEVTLEDEDELAKLCVSARIVGREETKR